MNRPPKRDYGRWNLPHFNWTTSDAFISETQWQDGIHTINLPTGPSLDIMLDGGPLTSGTGSVPIFFSGAVQDRQDKSGPFFSGSNVSLAGRFPYIAISDPSMELDATLGLAWYAGSQDQPLANQISLILTRFAEASRRELLLVGGSGGGYAALFYGQRLGDLASTLVWNAQTDVLEYNEKFVKNYLSVAFPHVLNLLGSPDWKQDVRNALSADGVELSLLDPARIGKKPRRSVFIQNATDWHVAVHAAPFLKANDYKHRGRGLHAASENHVLWISHYGADHAPLSPESVIFLIGELLDSRRTALDVVSCFRESGLTPEQQPGREPRDLRHLSRIIEDELSLELNVQGDQIMAQVALGDVPAGYGGLRFGFFEVDSEGKSSNIKWYSPETDCRTIQCRAGDGQSIRVRVRDGFNNELFSLEQPVPPSKTPAKTRFFIYGSCVTRDAFAMDHEFELVDYIARSSIGSAFAPPPSEIPVGSESIPSKFQRRMARTDVQKDLARLIRDTLFDYLLIDLIDERLQVMEFQDSVITYSAEIQKAGITADTDALTPVGSEEFYQRWTAGFRRLLSLCPPEKILINKVFWATIDDTGAKLPNQDHIAANNSVLQRLYEHIALTRGIEFIEHPSDTFVADTKHRWGLAPYHFTGDVSAHLLQELEGRRK